MVAINPISSSAENKLSSISPLSSAANQPLAAQVKASGKLPTPRPTTNHQDSALPHSSTFKAAMAGLSQLGNRVTSIGSLMLSFNQLNTALSNAQHLSASEKLSLASNISQSPLVSNNMALGNHTWGVDQSSLSRLREACRLAEAKVKSISQPSTQVQPLMHPESRLSYLRPSQLVTSTLKAAPAGDDAAMTGSAAGPTPEHMPLPLLKEGSIRSSAPAVNITPKLVDAGTAVAHETADNALALAKELLEQAMYAEIKKKIAGQSREPMSQMNLAKDLMSYFMTKVTKALNSALENGADAENIQATLSQLQQLMLAFEQSTQGLEQHLNPNNILMNPTADLAEIEKMQEAFTQPLTDLGDTQQSLFNGLMETGYLDEMDGQLWNMAHHDEGAHAMFNQRQNALFNTVNDMKHSMKWDF